MEDNKVKCFLCGSVLIKDVNISLKNTKYCKRCYPEYKVKKNDCSF